MDLNRLHRTNLSPIDLKIKYRLDLGSVMKKGWHWEISKFSYFIPHSTGFLKSSERFSKSVSLKICVVI
jgi:hypothetical protein